MTEEKEKVLSCDQLRELDNAHNSQIIKAKDLEIADLKLKKAQVELKLISANFTLKSREVDDLVLEKNKKNSELKEQKNKGAEITKKIGMEFDLDGAWGYDPLTGEISNE